MKTLTRLIAILMITALVGGCAAYGTQPMEKEKQSGPWPAKSYNHD